MFPGTQLVRQLIIAALFLPMAAEAQVAARFQAEDGTVIVTGLSERERLYLTDGQQRVRLQLSERPDAAGMLAKLLVDRETVRIKPRFSLLAGQTYDLKLNLPRGSLFETRFSLQEAVSPVPLLTGFAPGEQAIPENTLRLYLTFSQPMARGQIKENIRLQFRNGEEVESPFLNLGVELWDREQKRLTLLFDPGRIKQGVGPNLRSGAPLKAGKTYDLVISGNMKSADGQKLDKDHKIGFSAIEAVRREIDPEDWQVFVPQVSTRQKLSIKFDRLMDVGASQRLIKIHGPFGSSVSGLVETDGWVWTIKPKDLRRAGQYQLVIDPVLEDVSGNTIGSQFDSQPGTMGTVASPVGLEFVVN